MIQRNFRYMSTFFIDSSINSKFSVCSQSRLSNKRNEVIASLMWENLSTQTLWYAYSLLRVSLSSSLPMFWISLPDHAYPLTPPLPHTKSATLSPIKHGIGHKEVFRTGFSCQQHRQQSVA